MPKAISTISNKGDIEMQRLINSMGKGDAEVINSADMIDRSLRQSLGGIDPAHKIKIEEEIKNREGFDISRVKFAEDEGSIAQRRISKVSSISGNSLNSYSGTIDKDQLKTKNEDLDYETLLLLEHDVREKLIEMFESYDLEEGLAEDITNQINKMGSIINYLGGEVDKFEPLDHINGLSSPDSKKNAELVVNTTIQCYRFGNVESAKISKDGRTISILFCSNKNGSNYKSQGLVTCKNGWSGNEAIDYIFNGNSGKMSVKSFENGRWINKSNSDSYDIRWKTVEDRKNKEEVSQKLENKNAD